MGFIYSRALESVSGLNLALSWVRNMDLCELLCLLEMQRLCC